MKRLMLATTAVIALAAPALAQSGAEDAVREALMTRGYEASAIDMLTDAQVTELYLALTSENASNVDLILSGIDFGGTPANADTSGDDMQMAAVDELLVEAGYPAGTVSRLTSAQVTELFIASTSEDPSDIATIIDGLGLEGETGTPGDSDAAMFVQAELERRGVDAAVIAGLTDAEIAELYLALTSEDENQISVAIEAVTSM